MTAAEGPPRCDVEAALARAGALLSRPGRHLLGICGLPGAGKSTLAERIAAEFGPLVTVVPMDGFHLSDAVLDGAGLRHWKGRPDTFDAWGYRAQLARLREESDRVVYAPGFERTLEQPIAAAISVPTDCRLVVSEGNYLLHDVEPWGLAAQLFDEVWFCEADENVRLQQLLERHVRFGKTPEAASAWVERVDQPNAELILRGRWRADLIVGWS